MNGRLRGAFLALVAVLISTVGVAAQDHFGKWPEGASPKEVGTLLAENWVKRDFEFQSGRRQFLIYPEVCTWYGALNVVEETGNDELQGRLVKKFDRFLTPTGLNNISPAAHVDYRVIGIVPLEIYLQNNDVRHLAFGQDLADKQ